jgi:hypothetical protein
MKRTDGTNAGFSNAPTRENKKSSAGLLKSFSVFRTSVALWRRGDTNGFSRHIVKSFVVLSVRERSSGNSELIIPHSTRVANAGRSILTAILRLDIIANPLVALYSSLRLKERYKLCNRLECCA